jgi:hypothetical protein
VAKEDMDVCDTVIKSLIEIRALQNNILLLSELDNNHNAYTKDNCPLGIDDNHLENSKIIFGMEKYKWKCGFCGYEEYIWM